MSIIQNAVQIVENWPDVFYLVSTHVHDFRTYVFRDKTEISVDGGTGLDGYIRRVGDVLGENGSGGYATKWVDWSLDSAEPFDTIKERLLWGTYGKSSIQKTLTFKLIKDLELDHLKAIVKTQKNISKIHLKVIKYWIKEKEKDSKFLEVKMPKNRD